MLTTGLITASVTEGLVNSMSDFVREGGLPAIFVLMAVSAAERAASPQALAARRSPRWRPITSCGIEKRSSSSTVCA